MLIVDRYEDIDATSNDIDYLETTIKCIELYQWLSRHFNNKNFEYVLAELLENKAQAVNKLNELLSEKSVRSCSSCGIKIDENSQFRICEKCFNKRKTRRYPPRNKFESDRQGADKQKGRPSSRSRNNKRRKR